MSSRGFTVAAIGTILVLTGFTAVPAHASISSMQLPRWTKGDYWIYYIEGVAMPGKISGMGDYKLEVLGTEKMQVGSTVCTCYHSRIWMNLSNNGGATTDWYTADDWVDPSNLGTARVDAYWYWYFGSWLYVNTTYGPPMPYEFPMMANETWSATSIIETHTVGNTVTSSWTNVTLSENVTVEPPANISLSSNNTLSTLPVWIKGSDGSSFIESWSSDVGNIVERLNNYSPTSWGVGIYLRSYRYSPSATGTIIPWSMTVWIFVLALAVGVPTVVGLFFFWRSRIRARGGHGPTPPGTESGQSPQSREAAGRRPPSR